MLSREDSKTITKAQREDAVERLRVFREWFRKNIIESDKGHAILILPVENVYPRYRDEHPRLVLHFLVVLFSNSDHLH